MHSLDDLYLAAGVMAVVSVVAGGLCAWFGRHLGRQAKLLGMLGLVGLLVWIGFHLRGSMIWARIIPWSGVPVAGNWAMPLAAMVLGLGWSNLPKGIFRRLIVMLPLVGIGGYSTLMPLFVRVPYTNNDVVDGINRQTTRETCSPAAGATLLRWHGIGATEGEMADLSRTSDRGTSGLGLYRALTLKTRGTPFVVEVLTGGNRQMLGTRGMAILTVGYNDSNSPQAKELIRNGFQPGVYHSVVFFRFLPNGVALIGDPATGMEQWPAQTLDFLWHGEAIYLANDPNWQP